MKYKLVAFDVDGTLIDEIVSVWRMVHEEFGIDGKKLDEATSLFFSGKLTFSEWAQHDIDLWKEAGVTRKDIESVISKFRLMDGATETLMELKKRGYKLAIISGGLHMLVSHFIPNADEVFDYIVINRLEFDSAGKIVRCRTPQEFDDGEHKAKVLRILAEREGISIDECVFVGDAYNDVDVIKAAGLGIAFNAKREVTDVGDVVIEKKDLREILKYLH
jgi:phosphoserine phosphatase